MHYRLASSYKLIHPRQPLSLFQIFCAITSLSNLVRHDQYLIDANKENLETFAPATAQKNINLKVLNELLLPIPLLPEQTEIVNRVEQLFAFADQIEQQVQSAQNRVNNLTQAILAKAFKGELTADWRAQHHELISGETAPKPYLINQSHATKPKYRRAG